MASFKKLRLYASIGKRVVRLIISGFDLVKIKTGYCRAFFWHSSIKLVMLGCLLLIGSCGQFSSSYRPDLVRTDDSNIQKKRETIELGNDLTGESCRGTESDDAPESYGGNRIFDVFCGKWTQPSGRLVIAKGAVRDTQGIAGIVLVGDWRRNINNKLICESPVAVQIFDNIPEQWLKCTRRAGGLPHVAFVTFINNVTYFGDGLPASQISLERLIGILSGKLAPTDVNNQDQSQNSSAQLLKKQFEGKLVGSADSGQFDRLMLLGRSFSEEGNYRDSANYYSQALELQQKMVGTNNPSLAYTLMFLATSLSNGQRFIEANQLYDRCRNLLKKSTDPDQKSLFTYYLATHFANQQKFDKAEKLALEAGEMFEQQNLIKKGVRDAEQSILYQMEEAGASSSGSQSRRLDLSVGELTSKILAARMMRLQGDLSASQNLIEKLQQMAQINRIKSPSAYAQFAETASLNLDDLGRRRESEIFIQNAVAFLTNQLENSQIQVRSLFALGKIEFETGRTTRSLVTFRKAAAIAVKRGYSFPMNVIFPYMNALYQRILSNPAETAAVSRELFEASQLATSGTTAQFIADAAAQLAQGSSEGSAAIRQFREKNEDIDRTQSKMDAELTLPSESQDPVKIANLSKSIKELTKLRDEAEVKVQALAPNFNLLRFKSVKSEDLFNILQPGEGFLFIRLGTENSYGFLVFDGKIKVYQIALNFNSVQAAVEQLRDAVVVDHNEAGQPVIRGFDVKASYQLYKDIMGPIASEIPKMKKLIVSQTGSLLSLPFAMLVTQKPTDNITDFDYHKVRFLLQDVTLAYVTSIQSFVILRSNPAIQKAPRPFAGFGDYIQPPKAYLASKISDPICKADLDALVALGPLPGTRPEVQQIAKAMGARKDETLLGDQFTKDNLLKFDLGKYRILHFATHALLPTDLKCRSTPTMLISQGKKNDNIDNIYFDSNDVLELHLNAEMVVLSACNTSSQGDVSAGESLSGLAQSFFVSGARGLIVSHWLAADQSTMEMMINFYKTLAGKQHDMATAMRMAQLDIFDRAGKDLPMLFSHPLFWAVFTPIGDGYQPNKQSAAEPEPSTVNK